MRNSKAAIVWSIWLLSTGLWVVHPFVMIKYFLVTLNLNWYPPEADSIGIPIIGGFFLAIVGYPFFFFLCLRASWAFQTPFSFSKWDRDRPKRSLIISVVFGLLALFSLISAVDSYHLLQEIRASKFRDSQDVAVYRILLSLGWVLLWLTLRSCFMTRSPKVPESASETVGEKLCDVN